METLSGRPYWALSFSERGRLLSPEAGVFLDEVAATGVQELIVLSHGWNTGREDAESLYGDLLPRIADAASRSAALGPAGLVGIHWPSIWFPEPPAPARAAARRGDAQTSQPTAPLASGDAELPGPVIAEALAAGFEPTQAELVAQLGVLVAEGEAGIGAETPARQEERLAEFHALVRQVLPDPARVATEDAGELELLLSDDPARDYAFIAREFGGASDGGSAQDLGDRFRAIWKGAKDVLRITSYYVMKARAGDVGRDGLGPLLTQLHGRVPTVRVHLVGHSFGGRLVAFALAGIPSAADSPVASLVLIQAAFSHYSFSSPRANPFAADGALRHHVDRVHGPLVATFSEHDWAVGRWYPKASALARQDNQANPAVSRWGGLGEGGFQAVTPLEGRELLAAGGEYGFAAGCFYAVDGSAVIDDWQQSAFAGAHSDIRRPEVAWVVASAAAAGADDPPRRESGPGG